MQALVYTYFHHFATLAVSVYILVLRTNKTQWTECDLQVLCRVMSLVKPLGHQGFHQIREKKSIAACLLEEGGNSGFISGHKLWLLTEIIRLQIWAPKISCVFLRVVGLSLRDIGEAQSGSTAPPHWEEPGLAIWLGCLLDVSLWRCLRHVRLGEEPRSSGI